MSEFLCALDFWIERYQTLIAATVALLGVYFALVPAWRQVAIMEDERLGKVRQKLVETYRDIAAAMVLLDPEVWRSAMPYARPLSDEEKARDSIKAELLSAYRQRKARWAKIKAGLMGLVSADQHKLLGPIGWIDSRFEECDRTIETDRDPASFDLTEYWFYTADYPDMMVTHQMQEARIALQQTASAIVEKVVDPSAD